MRDQFRPAATFNSLLSPGTFVLGGFLLAVTACFPNVAFGDDNGSWAGQKIMPKQAHTWIGHTDESGRQLYVVELTDVIYTVLKEQDGWLLVRHRGVVDWLNKEQALLVEEALSYFGQRIRANSWDSFACGQRGRAWKEEGELERALRDLDEAIRLDPYRSAWFSSRGLVYDELQEYDLAIRDYSEALRREPKDPLTYLNRGRAYRAKKDYDQAIRDYDSAISLDPKWSDAYFHRANVYKAKREYERAVSDYSEAIRLEPEWSDAYFNRARAHQARKAYYQAAGDYSEVLRLDPKDADAYSSLAWLLATCPDDNVRDGKKAVEYARKACELTSWEASYFLATLGAAYAEMRRFDEAIQWQKRALQSPRYERVEGEKARQRIRLFEDRRPYREE
jgi:tetratricopeptide (TPR) repeat protein